MTIKSSTRSLLPTFLVAGWLLFTLSLSAWWLVHGLMLNRKLAELNSSFQELLVRQNRMLFFEGIAFVGVLLLGGASLLMFTLREHRRNQALRDFFATFTHELKTPLASLRLQAESLQEDLQQTPHRNLVDRLVKDTARLELHMENALFLATVNQAEQVREETLSVRELLAPIQSALPDIAIKLDKDVLVKADPRALESIFKNLIHNSKVHGKATQFEINASSNSDKILLQMKDNGSGFKGDANHLGRLFHRHNPQSGSGVGLHLSRILARKMGGDLRFTTSPSSTSLLVEMELQRGGA